MVGCCCYFEFPLNPKSKLGCLLVTGIQLVQPTYHRRLRSRNAFAAPLPPRAPHRFAPPLDSRRRKQREQCPTSRSGLWLWGQQPRRGRPAGSGRRLLRAHSRALPPAVREQRRRRALPLPRRICRR
jgi:hypothetical protein